MPTPTNSRNTLAIDGGSLKVSKNEHFLVPSYTFTISPLSQDADLYIDSVSPGVTNSLKVLTVPGNGKYSTVHQYLTPGTEVHLDTQEDFYIIWSK